MSRKKVTQSQAIKRQDLEVGVIKNFENDRLVSAYGFLGTLQGQEITFVLEDWPEIKAIIDQYASKEVKSATI